MDKADIREVLRRFAPVALFGHEHSARLLADEKQVQLFAGSLQPERDAAGWLPTYHILQLAIDGTLEQPKLRVRVHTREFDRYNFRAWRYENEETVFERTLPMPPFTPPAPDAGVASQAPLLQAQRPPATMPSSETQSGTSAADAKRELLVHFFQLRTPQRYEVAFKAGLLRDGDDALDPQSMWAEVFRRAETEKKLGTFWAAVAVHTPAIAQKPNPFMGGDSA
jgi:hypothetical protein